MEEQTFSKGKGKRTNHHELEFVVDSDGEVSIRCNTHGKWIIGFKKDSVVLHGASCLFCDCKYVDYTDGC